MSINNKVKSPIKYNKNLNFSSKLNSIYKEDNIIINAIKNFIELFSFQNKKLKFILENEGKLFLILLNNNDNEDQMKMKLDHIINLNIIFSKI